MRRATDSRYVETRYRELTYFLDFVEMGQLPTTLVPTYISHSLVAVIVDHIDKPVAVHTQLGCWYVVAVGKELSRPVGLSKTFHPTRLTRLEPRVCVVNLKRLKSKGWS